MGLPSIVTNWSGTADFVDETVGYLLNYTLSKVSGGVYGLREWGGTSSSICNCICPVTALSTDMLMKD